jgi:hypothetical protein
MRSDREDKEEENIELKHDDKVSSKSFCASAIRESSLVPESVSGNREFWNGGNSIKDNNQPSNPAETRKEAR